MKEKFPFNEKKPTGDGNCTIRINGQRSLRVAGGGSLLSVLAGRNIFLPTACGGRGICKLCKCRITDGADPPLPKELAALSQEELENHIRLSCQAVVKRDMAIEIPDSLFRIRETQAE